MTARVRAATATVYVNSDPAIGSDTLHSGTSPSDALFSLQRAMDFATGNFDLEPPYPWTFSPDGGYRPGVTIQMAPNGLTYEYDIYDPLYNDGGGSGHPVTLRGDPSNPFNAYIRVNNTFQGVTAQGNGETHCDGFAIYGRGNCTLLNSLHRGLVSAKNVWMGPKIPDPPGAPATGPTAAFGAAGVSRFETRGFLGFWGSASAAICTVIEESQVILKPGTVLHLNNPMNFGKVFGLQRGSVWTQGSPPAFTGDWSHASSSGQKFSATNVSFMGIHGCDTIIPGFGYLISTATTALNAGGNPLPANWFNGP